MGDRLKKFKIAFLAGALATTAACRKTPLEDNFGDVDFATAYWFSAEKVAYVFFSIKEKPERLLDSVWELSYTYASADGGTTTVPYEVIDFGAGVHEHQQQACGHRRVCGSYSFPLARQLINAEVRFRYDRGSSLARQRVAFVNNATTLSALVYGVFDGPNEHVQLRVHNNFPLGPKDDEVASYGLKRRFAVGEPALKLVANEEQQALHKKLGHDFLFPADFCADTSTPPDAIVPEDNRVEALSWFSQAFLSERGENGACFATAYLDRDGKVFFRGPSYARKNPAFGDAGLRLTTPLQEAIQLPVVLNYCEDTDFFSELTSPGFLEYQKFITGLYERPVDVCFKLGAEEDYRVKLEKFLASSLTAAKAQHASDSRDFVYVVVFHEKLNAEFRRFHEITAETLAKISEEEATKVSPKLAGAFVYATATDFKPNATQRRRIIWCPQQLLTPEEQATEPADPYDQENCTTWAADTIGTKFLNFTVPLGPFPSLSVYENYVRDNGDRGLSKNPSLVFRTVPTGADTKQDSDGQITYFNNQRLTVQPGESIRVCHDRDPNGDLYSFRFLKLGGTAAVAEDQEAPAPLDIFAAEKIWRSETDAPGEYKIGINWEFPFWAGLRYSVTGRGKIAFIIPFQKTARAFEILDGEKWQTEAWPFGDYIQYCRAFCDQPFFDDRGVYQVNSSWREHTLQVDCPASQPPKWPGE